MEVIVQAEDNKRLKGSIVVVTGAARSIGLACAQRMAEQGATVVMTDIDSEEGQARCEELQATGLQVDFQSLDVSSEEGWQALLDHVLCEYERLDVLVNNAGICLPSTLENLSFDDFKRMTSINVDGTFLGCRAAILAMRKSAKGDEAPQGSIVNIASIAGQTAVAGLGGYCTSKAAVTNMTKALAIECAERREFIRVNSVHPGTVRSQMTETLYGTEYFDDPANFASVPLKDYAVPEDIADAVVYLASAEARLVTGSELTVDGGFTAGIGGEF
jgi:NAD(P)-dependent dehydrogenase (short-subunit alcohol dehydrogenase family)